MSTGKERPRFEEITTGTEFSRWYWLKAEMVEICKRAGLPITGSKFEIRDRIIYALDHQGKIKPTAKKKKTTSAFNWAKAELTLATKITDSISFGPNFRNFMKSHIGKKFSCHSDFMNWVKENSGKTLEDAIAKWHELEARKKDPNFKRKIAPHNMYAQYTRDFLEANPNLTPKDARKYWLLKKQLPTETGFVIYEPSDLNL